MNNRRLFIALIALVGVLLLGKIFRGNPSGSFDPELIRVDTSRVDRIIFKTGGTQPEEFEIRRSADGWQASKDKMMIKVSASQMQNILSPLVLLTASRLVSRDTTRYAEYEISKAQASEVIVYTGKKVVADLRLGGFRFDQASRTASTYVRKAKGPEVYLIDGFSTMGLKARFDQFRDKSLLKLRAEDITSIQWSDAAGRKEVVQQEDGAWYYAGMEAVDSMAFATYLQALTSAQGLEFSDVTSSDGLALAEKITLFGHNMLDPATIEAYISDDADQPFLIHSSINPDAFFRADSTGLYRRLFSDLKVFWPNGQ